MALDITYYFALDRSGQTLGISGGRASVSLTAISADCGVVPTGAIYAKITAGEDSVVSNNGADASATNGQLIKTGATFEMAVPREGQFKARTA